MTEAGGTARRVSAGLDATARRLRVLWLIKGLGPGGAETLLVHQARAGSQRWAIECDYLLGHKNHLVAALTDADVQVVHLAGRAWPLALWRRLGSTDFDVVHTHSPALAPVVRLLVRFRRLARRTDRPTLVYTEHNRWDSYRVPTRLANAATIGLEDAVVAVSDGVAQSMSPRARTHAAIVVHGIDQETLRKGTNRADARRSLGVEPDDFVVGSVANLRREKDIPNLIAAAKLACAADPSIVVVHIGQGPLAAEIEAAHARSGLGDRFRLLGYRPDAANLIAGFDLFTLSSSSEGLPVAVMEAMSLGVPIVCTAVGGVPSAVEGAGRLVPPGDPAALAAGWAAAKADPEATSQMAQVSADRFDIAHAVAELDRIYRAALGSAPVAAEPMTGSTGSTESTDTTGGRA